jgi:Arc/MetJ-type ribon-helix-helix transcriptional regulator
MYTERMYGRMSRSDASENDPQIDRINVRLSRSFLDVVDETWRERGFNSRSEFIRYALRDSVNHPEGAALWKDLARSEAELEDDNGVESDEIRTQYGTPDE